MIYRRALAAAVAAGVVVTAPTGAAAAATVGAAPTGPGVTLLTGDRVTLGGTDGATVRPAQGREHVAFYIRSDAQGDTHVIPEDALVPLSQGKLDLRLFDVSELVRTGYDDASRDRLPLIVDYAGPTPRAAGVQVSRELPAMSAAAVSVERTAGYWATAQKAEHVWLDGPVRASLDRSVPQIGAPEAWGAGHTGAGATVAVLDTGIDVTHPDLADAVTDARNFTDSDTADDRVGHGTHVASTVTGNNDRYRGVAPDAKLLNGKVLNDGGFGLESWIIAGMEWAAANADVVNMSLGSDIPSDGTDPMSQAVNRITAETGALFVVAAGNTGKQIGSPAAADAALTVGAVDRDDQLADFSSRGPRLNDGAAKPDITAPGVDIVAAKAANGWLGEPAGDGYVAMSGTSMATPHVAGAAAILAGQHPDWTAEQLKATLMGSAKPNGTVFEQGAGRVDVAAASTSTVFASPSVLNNGIVQWPHEDDQPIAKTLTYTNTGSEPVVLDLTTEGGPQRMFAVEPAQLTVPAGGQATATVTTDTSIDVDHGVYSGLIVAAGAQGSVRTPIAVNREVESYNVTMTFIDHNGKQTDQYGARLLDVDNPKEYLPYNSSGKATMRLPKGEYYFDATVALPVPEIRDFYTAEFVEPSLNLNHDITLVLDARQAKSLGFDLDRPNMKKGNERVMFARDAAWGPIKATRYMMVPGRADLGTVMPATTRHDTFTFTAEQRLAEWNGEAFTGSYLYHVRHTEKGTVPATLRWRYRDYQFAKVRSEHAVATPGTIGLREDFLPVALPSTLTEFYTPNVPWDGGYVEFSEQSTDPTLIEYQVEPRSFKLGRVTTERWNAGVFGPALPKGLHSDDDFAGRRGDRLGFFLPLVTDQGRGRMGTTSDEGTTTLLRDGQVVGELPSAGFGGFDVGPERAEYTLRATAVRPAARLSTEISVEWTFTSEHTTEPTALPLLALRFAPDLDDHNAAPAGKRFSIPFYLQRNGGAEVGTVSTPAVEVSYDDGATWRSAKVRHGKVTVDHPADAEFVSLRSSVTDADGNAQRQTIIRAYALK